MLRKYKIEYTLLCRTGLQIGAGNSSFDIGGIDNPVIKNPITGEPYIPGSSLKGKMRSLLEWDEASKELKDSGGKVLNNIEKDVCKLFGISASEKDEDKSIKIARAIVRDSFLTDDSRKMLNEKLGENIFTEIKAENTINRLTSIAKPRFFERVPKGAEFKGEIIFTVYIESDEKLLDTLFIGMQLLEDNYLGGSGTRGSGQVEFKDIKIIKREKEYYLGEKDEEIQEYGNIKEIRNNR